MAWVWREGEKARGRWGQSAPQRTDRGPRRGPSKAKGVRKRPRMAQEHLTEREADREPREATQRRERPKRSKAAGAPLQEGSQRGCGARGRGASRKEEVR